MLIVCPNCATSYDVDVASLRPDGRRVRCVRCRMIWHAELPNEEKLIAAADALAPVRRAVEAVAEVATADPPAEQFDAARGAEAAPAAEPKPDPFVVPPPPGSPDGAESPVVAEDSSVEVESPSIAPGEAEDDQPPIDIEADSNVAPSPEPLEDIETIAARRYPREGKRWRLQWPLSRLQSGIMALIVANAIVISWRDDFVRAMPQTASFYAWLDLPVNIRGLDFENLATTTEQHEGVPILVIGGNIVNITGRTETVPHLRFAVRNAARQEIYAWTAVPPLAMLPPGRGVAFHSRLASPPPDAHDVVVRFLNRNDVLAGAR
ncbi:MAG: MJ0042-type zinc finger domain-containing protein [Xanthobacteraceae bacterium]